MARWLARDTFLSKSNMTSTPTFTRIAQVATIEWSMTTEFTSFDDHDVTAGFLVKVPVSKDAGEIALSGNYDPEGATHITLEDEYYGNMTSTPVNYKLTYNSTSATTHKIKTFSAFVGTWAGTANASDKLTFSSTLVISGQPDSTGS